jgi:hypothetical protein
LGAGSVLFADAPSASPSPAAAGLLGTDYVDLSLSATYRNQPNGWKRTDWDAGLSVTKAVQPGLDLSLAYDHWNYDGSPYSWQNYSGQDVSVSATEYLTRDAFKPFISLGLGYEVLPDTKPWYIPYDRAFTGGLGSGVEYTINPKFAVEASLGYGRTFKPSTAFWRNHSWHANLRGLYAINARLSLAADLTWLEFGRIQYTIATCIRY